MEFSVKKLLLILLLLSLLLLFLYFNISILFKVEGAGQSANITKIASAPRPGPGRIIQTGSPDDAAGLFFLYSISALFLSL